MSSTLERLDGTIPLRPLGLRGTLNDFYELSKPRIMYLLLITTFAAMVMAAHGLPPFGLIVGTLVGGALAAGSAGAFNCVIERKTDMLMVRTMTRPAATGRISAASGYAFAVSLGILSFAILYYFTNPLAAWLSLAGNAYYVVIYTMWLKRATTLNIVIGGAAGAVPPLVGWAAVAHSVGGPALGLFALIFLWTPPHFWALALMANTDYKKAGIPMLPNVRGDKHTKLEIFIYTIVLVVMSLSLTPLGIMGLWYFIPAAILGAIFLWDAWKMLRGGPTKPLARIVFKYSLLYLAAMCAAMVVDRLLS